MRFGFVLRVFPRVHSDPGPAVADTPGPAMAATSHMLMTPPTATRVGDMVSPGQGPGADAEGDLAAQFQASWQDLPDDLSEGPDHKQNILSETSPG